MKSLLGRLGLGMTIGLLLLFIFQWWVVNSAMHHITEEYVLSHLQHESDNLLGALRSNGQGSTMELNPGRINGVFQMPFSGHYYLVSVDGQNLPSRSLWDNELQLPAVFDKAVYGPGPQGQTLLLLKQRFHKQGSAIVITVAEDMSPLEDNLHEFQLRYTVITLVVLVIVVIFQTWQLKHGLTPLEQVRDDVVRLEQGEVLRLRENVPREVLPLVVEFNQLLELMQQRLSRSRTALGNLAHALKTPLTVLSRLADSDSMQSQPELRAQLREQSGKISQLLDYQLKRARLAGSSAPGWQFRLHEELTPLADTLERIYTDRQITIEMNLPEGQLFSADREDMLELFGNLLDNACKWANSLVLLTVHEGEGLRFTVEDDGPGAPAELRDQLTQRGVRLDETTLGHGLGLAIVKEIVDQYGGEIRFDQSKALGGFLVQVTLPRR
jgi:signal transduction histidine kinase